MCPDKGDMSHLWDILDAAKAALEFVSELDYDDFVTDRRTRNAVERNLEIIGEAVRRLSAQTREAHSDIPWRSMIGLRNVLAHAYDDVRVEVIWRLVQEKLPPLIQRLEKMGVDSPPDEIGG